MIELNQHITVFRRDKHFETYENFVQIQEYSLDYTKAIPQKVETLYCYTSNFETVVAGKEGDY